MGESQMNSANHQSGEEPMEEPSREKLEEKITNVMGIIQELEAELKSAYSEGGETGHSRLREIRAQKESTISHMKKIEDDIQAHNKQIGLQRENLMKCQSNLHYKREDKINEAIKRLEYQLGTQNFRPTEEKKIIQEIDRLKKSKRSLSTYLELRTQLDKLREEQNNMRDMRDALYRKKTTLRTDEDEARNAIAESGKRIEQLKKDIDGMYDQKRKLISDFRQARKEYLNSQHLQLQKKNQNQRKETKITNEKTVLNPPNSYTRTVAVQRPERPAPRIRRESTLIEPYNEEITTCNILIKYLHRIGFTSAATCSAPESTEKGCCVKTINKLQVDLETTENSQKAEEEMCTVMETRRKKRDKRFKKKYLVLTPDIFAKFDKIGLSPPTTYTEIPCALEKIAAKKAEYTYLSTDGAHSHGEEADTTKLSLTAEKSDIRNVESCKEKAKHEDRCCQIVQNVLQTESCNNSDTNSQLNCSADTLQLNNVETVHNAATSTCSKEYEPEEKCGQTMVLVEDIKCNLDAQVAIAPCTLETSIVSC